MKSRYTKEYFRFKSSLVTIDKPFKNPMEFREFLKHFNLGFYVKMRGESSNSSRIELVDLSNKWDLDWSDGFIMSGTFTIHDGASDDNFYKRFIPEMTNQKWLIKTKFCHNIFGELFTVKRRYKMPVIEFHDHFYAYMREK